MEIKHECAWEVMLSISKNIYAVCLRCDECMDKEEIAARLNEYGPLKAALSIAMNENTRLTKIVEERDD